MTSSPAKACNDNLVTLERYRFPHEAHIAQGLLESHGIDAYVADEHILSANWLNPKTIGDVRLQVLEADFSKAQKLLSITTNEEDVTHSPCLSCQSKHMSKEKPAWLVPSSLLILIINFYIALLLIPDFRRKKCPDCGHLRD